jgi:hypothetical protein
LANVRFLSSGQLQTEWIAQTIDRRMNLGAESTTARSQCLSFLTATFLGASRTGISPANRAVNHPGFHIRVVGKVS